MAAVSTVPPTTTLRARGCSSALRLARQEGLMLHFQGDPGKGAQPPGPALGRDLPSGVQALLCQGVPRWRSHSLFYYLHTCK